METARTRAPDRLVLDRYRLERKLGSGGFGTVWLAHDEKLDRMVAVKRIGVEDPSIATRAEREAKAAARLSHPSIVALYESQAAEDAVFLVSELVRGRTLRQLLDDGELSDRDVLLIGVALCDALAHAHGRGVVHRDVKPANVLVPDDGGVAKLTDFGIARLLGEDALTRTGDVVGTLAYMAPEQAEGQPAGEPADLYALALVLYEALSGTNPVRGRTPAATVRRVGVRLPALGRLRRDLPLDLCDALDRAVQPDPKARGTVKQLKAVLKAHVEDVGDEAGTVEASALEPLGLGLAREPRAPLADVAPRGPWSRRGVAAALAFVLVTAATATLGPPVPFAPAVLGAATALVVGAFPRAGWAASALAVLAWLLADGRTGDAVVLAAAAAPVVPLLRRAAPGWLSVPAAAPGLGALALAGAFPALAGQARRAADRAVLGALGAWWLLLAEPVAGTDLLFGPAPDTLPRDQFGTSAGVAVEHVLAPAVTGGALALAALWAAAAVVLPFLVRGRLLGLDLLAAAAWATGLGVGTQALADALGWAPSPTGVVAGAVVAGILAVLAAASRPRADGRW